MPLDSHLNDVLLQLAAAPQPTTLDEMRAAVSANAARTTRRPVETAARDLTLPGPGMIHGFANLTAISPAAAALIDRAAAWLGRELTLH